MGKVRTLVILFFILIISSLVVKGQTDPTIRLIIDSQSFTVFVASPVPTSLAGLSFRIIDTQGILQTVTLEESFQILQLTEGVAQAGTCFIYVQDGATPPLPSACSRLNLVYRRPVPRVDVFWYDFITNRQRDIAIAAFDQPTGDICSSTLVDCPIYYIAPEPPATMTPVASTTLVGSELPEGIVLSNAEWQITSQVFEDYEMVLVPQGCFDMGSSDAELEAALELCEAAAGKTACQNIAFDTETPQNEVCFDQPFWIDRYEVTNGQFGSSGRFSGEEKPRENVTWFEANNFCVDRDSRLPTEAEWEYAARGPDDLVFPWGNEFVFRNVVYKKNSANQTANVSRNAAGMSWVGAFHMSGNVWEWTATLFQDYPYDRTDGRENGSGNGVMVIRGGSWGDGDSIVRAAYRAKGAPNYHDDYTGFRCVQDFSPDDLNG